ncbi:MAG: ABC transporter ATP-binding protein [Deltaproteobacteria bacterium]|nr:ABC transporter ATP-binding protein [Deltaproteobacteria bacterium]
MNPKESQMLKTEGLTKYFGGLGAVVDLEFSVFEGQVTGIIGPNGAGKSTVLNMIAGSISPTGGRIYFKGEDVTNVPPHMMARRGIARVFQSNTLFENESVITNVRVGLYRHSKIGFLGAFLNTSYTQNREKVLYEEALRILEFIGLADQKDQHAVNLPHGSQRVLCLGVAMAVKPDLLLLDEPLTGMNAEEVDAMISMIKTLRDEKNITSIIVEHNMRAVMRLCDHIIVLNYGEKIAEGPPGEISQNPSVIQAYLGTEENDA